MRQMRWHYNAAGGGDMAHLKHETGFKIPHRSVQQRRISLRTPLLRQQLPPPSPYPPDHDVNSSTRSAQWQGGWPTCCCLMATTSPGPNLLAGSGCAKPTSELREHAMQRTRNEWRTGTRCTSLCTCCMYFSNRRYTRPPAPCSTWTLMSERD